MVVEGESLLNDGAAIVFFNVFLKLATSEQGMSGKSSELCVPWVEVYRIVQRFLNSRCLVNFAITV